MMNDRVTGSLAHVLLEAWAHAHPGTTPTPAQLEVLEKFVELEIAIRAAGAPMVDPLEPRGPMQ